MVKYYLIPIDIDVTIKHHTYVFDATTYERKNHGEKYIEYAIHGDDEHAIEVYYKTAGYYKLVADIPEDELIVLKLKGHIITRVYTDYFDDRLCNILATV